MLATGAYQRPHRPPGAATLPSSILQIDTEGYTNEAALPPGKVLLVGSGQTGCQLAEELCEAGRDVFLACGRAPWSSRRVADRDVFYWTIETGMLDETLADLLSPSARLIANAQATGHRGGHDLHYRVLQQIGVTLVGHFLVAEDGRARFASDLAASVAFGDARYTELRAKIARVCAARGIRAPDMPDPARFDAQAPETIDLAGFGGVIFTSGFRPDYSSWVHFDALDDMGSPIHKDGASTVTPGLYFCGVHFLRKRKSSLLTISGSERTRRSSRARSPRAGPRPQRRELPSRPAITPRKGVPASVPSRPTSNSLTRKAGRAPSARRASRCSHCGGSRSRRPRAVAWALQTHRRMTEVLGRQDPCPSETRGRASRPPADRARQSCERVSLRQHRDRSSPLPLRPSCRLLASGRSPAWHALCPLPRTQRKCPGRRHTQFPRCSDAAARLETDAGRSTRKPAIVAAGCRVQGRSRSGTKLEMGLWTCPREQSFELVEAVCPTVSMKRPTCLSFEWPLC